MDLWNEISKTLYSAADYTVKEAEKLTGIAKLKYKRNALKAKLDLYYKSIGELKYAERNGQEVADEMYSGLFEQVDAVLAEQKELESRLADLRDCVSCPQCGYKVQRGLSFCPKCGEKLPSDEKKAENTGNAEDNG